MPIFLSAYSLVSLTFLQVESIAVISVLQIGIYITTTTFCNVQKTLLNVFCNVWTHVTNLDVVVE